MTPAIASVVVAGVAAIPSPCLFVVLAVGLVGAANELGVPAVFELVILLELL